MIFDKNHKIEAIEYLDEIFAKGKKAKITEFKEIRTLDQNRLYWLWLTCIEKETGNDKNDLHEFFSLEYLPLVQQMVFKKLIYKRTSTTTLNTKLFTDYLDKIKQYALDELNIILPDTKDKYFNEFFEHYKDFI